jgi:hypothetical protein
MDQDQKETQTVCQMKRQMKRGFEASRLSGDLKRRKAQGSQTTIQQSLIDINVVYQQLPKDAPKIGQIAPQVKGFKQANAPQNFETFRFRQLARSVIV